MKISVIIPVYNAEKYLKRCLESLINSLVDELEVEIILVNDGSSDTSLDICRDFKTKYDYIKIFDQENKGPSAARNLGLQNATGDWIVFVDSDDYVEKNYFEVINNNLSQEIDVLVFSYWKIVDELRNSYSFEAKDLKKTDIINLVENSYNKMYLFWFPWNKLYKRTKIIDVYFPETIKIGEDTIYNLSVFLNSDYIKIIDNCLYNYVNNEDSLTQIKYNKNLLSNMVNHYNARKELHNKYNLIEHNFKKDIANYYINHILFWLLKNEQNNPVEDNNLTALKEIRNSIIYKECFPNYKYNWKHPKKSLIIKLFELRMYKLLLKIY